MNIIQLLLRRGSTQARPVENPHTQGLEFSLPGEPWPKRVKGLGVLGLSLGFGV